MVLRYNVQRQIRQSGYNETHTVQTVDNTIGICKKFHVVNEIYVSTREQSNASNAKSKKEKI